LPDIVGGGTPFCPRSAKRSLRSSLRTPHFILGIATTVANAMALGIAFVVCSYTW
jgi:uridylate kinase